jgi:long-chain fatty acid transport protein
MNRKGIAKIVASLHAVLICSVAGASGFQLLEQNASGLGNAYAGSAAVAENASTIYFNPAGLTQLKGMQASGGVTRVETTFKFHDNGSTSGAFTGTGDGMDAGASGTIPNFYVSSELSSNIYGGIGFGAPFGLKTQYQVPWAGAAQSTKFDIKTLNVNPSVAFKISERFSVGVGIDYQKLEAEYQRQASTLTAFSLFADTITLKADDHTWGWNAGVLWQASDSTRFGFSYRSAMDYHLKGDMQASGPTAALLAANVGPASASLTVPETFILSAMHKLNDQWELLGDVSHTRWSRIQHVDIVLDRTGATAQTLDALFRDTWRVALGANYKMSGAWKLKTGLGYDQGVVRNDESRLTSLPDSDRIWLSAGVQWTTAKSLTWDGGFTYIKLDNAGINNDQRTSNRGLVRGDYDGHIILLGVQGTYVF